MRSDIGFCVKRRVMSGLSDITLAFLRFHGIERISEFSCFYIIRGLKWDGRNPEIARLYMELSGLCSDDFYLVVNPLMESFDFEDNNEWNRGSWNDNDFGLRVWPSIRYKFPAGI